MRHLLNAALRPPPGAIFYIERRSSTTNLSPPCDLLPVPGAGVVTAPVELTKSAIQTATNAATALYEAPLEVTRAVGNAVSGPASAAATAPIRAAGAATHGAVDAATGLITAPVVGSWVPECRWKSEGLSLAECARTYRTSPGAHTARMLSAPAPCQR